MLGFLREQLGAVEINNTFYRMPTRRAARALGGRDAGGFRFALKARAASRTMQRLADVGDSVERLATRRAARWASSWGRSCSSCRRS